MTSPFSPEYVPVMPGPTKAERGGAASGRKLSAMNQAKLDRFGPSPAPTRTAEQKRADLEKARSILAGRRV